MMKGNKSYCGHNNINGTPQTSLDDSKCFDDIINTSSSFSRTRSSRQFTSEMLLAIAIPPLSSPVCHHYLLTISTFLLAVIGFACALSSGLSCSFLSIQYYGNNEYDEVAKDVSMEGYEGDGFETYDKDNLPSSIGIFCNSSNDGDQNGGTLQTLSKFFLSISLAISALLLMLTLGLSTIIPMISTKLWDAISYLSAFILICELPSLLILDSAPCKNEGVNCTLGNGSIPLFLSMVVHVLLTILVQWKEAPDWKEEYDLWKLMQQRNKKKSGNADERGHQTGESDEEQGLIGESPERYTDKYAVLESEHPTTTTAALASNHFQHQTKPKKMTESTIEKMNLLSNDDLQPTNNNVDTVDKKLIIDMAATRKENKQRVAHYLREERLKKAQSVKDERAKHGLKRKSSKEDNDTHGLPFAYISINDQGQDSIASSQNTSGPDVSTSVIMAAKKSPLVVSVTPKRISKNAGVSPQKDNNMSPISIGSMNGGKSTTTEDYGNAIASNRMEGRQPPKLPGGSSTTFPAKVQTKPVQTKPVAAVANVVPVIAVTPERQLSNATREVTPQSPITICSGIRTTYSQDKYDVPDSSKLESVSAKGGNAIKKVNYIEQETVTKQTKSEAANARNAVDADKVPAGFDHVSLASASFGNDAFGGDVFRNDSFGNNSVGKPDAAAADAQDVKRDKNINATTANEKEEQAGQKDISARDATAFRHFDDASIKSDSSSRSTNVASNLSRSSSSLRRIMKRSPAIFRRKSGKIADNNHGTADQHEDVEEGRVTSNATENLHPNIPDGSMNSNGLVPPPPAVVSPDKAHDPDINFYPSESSLSTLSLPTDDYRSSDDNNGYHRHNKEKSRGNSSGGESSAVSGSDTELSAVIAGVQKLNRKTSGKPTPLTKRRRRRRGKSRSVSSGNSYHSLNSYTSVSSRGSLLDEVIVEEGELNSSNEVANTSSEGIKGAKSRSVPVVIDASPFKKKKKDRSRSRGDSDHHGDGKSVKKKEPEEDEYYASGYESGRVSEAEESFSSRAARARRNRILSKRKQQHQNSPENGDDLSQPLFAKPTELSNSGDCPDDEVPRRGINTRTPPSTKASAAVDQGGDTAAWQARKVRMARLRMVHRGAAITHDVDNNVDAAATNVADDSSFDPLDKEGQGVIRRAQEGMVLACSSDEDSI